MLRDIMAAIYRSEPVLQESGGQGPDCRRSAGAGATSPLLPNGRHASTCHDSAHYRRQADLSVLISEGLKFGYPIEGKTLTKQYFNAFGKRNESARLGASFWLEPENTGTCWAENGRRASI